MWRCDNCETKNEEQSRFCMICGRERQSELSFGEGGEGQKTDLLGTEQQSTQQKSVEPVAVPTGEDDDWEDAPKVGSGDIGRMHTEHPLSTSGVAWPDDLASGEKVQKEPLPQDQESISKKRYFITALVILVIAALVAAGIHLNNRYTQYNDAIAYYERGTKEDLQKALRLMEDLDGLFDSVNWENKIEREIQLWVKYEEAGNAWDRASESDDLNAMRTVRDLFAELKDFEDSEEKLQAIETRIGYIEEAQKIDEAIKSGIDLSSIVLNDESSINKLRKQYDDAPSNVKKYVKQLWLLESAESSIVNVKETVSRVEARIDAIDLGNVTLYSKDVIETAWNSYNDLGENKQYVSDDRVYCLSRAREAYKQCCLNEGKRLLRTMQDEEYNGNMFYYTDSHPKYNNERTYVLPYIGINPSNHNIWIRFRFNYFGKQNIEFAKIRVNCDGSTRSYDVNEYSYASHPYNGYVKNEDIGAYSVTRRYMNSIAYSNITTVQFIDSNGNVTAEHTISEKDKRAFQDVLDTYNYLIESGEYFEYFD